MTHLQEDTQMNDTNETIDLTPTWAAMLPGLLAILFDSESFEDRRLAEKELTRMAHLADRYVHAQRAEAQQAEETPR